ncbi:serine protease [Pragia fontium]|uniref:Serine protease n=1 Tax=Pragia fontium TaxID=82985 RepID=A0ABQ5LM47_9GAMM|nr:S8 family serine peptidase [Pragia fontium]GKX64698.1 serine protease [Pragia fontium]
MSSKNKVVQKSLYLTGNTLFAMMVAACGGGGGGGGGSSNTGSSETSVPPTGNNLSIISPTAPISRNIYNQSLFMTNTAAARESGFTGAGIIIGLVDSGVLTSNLNLQGAIVQSLSYVDPRTNNTNVGDVRGHGTMVAQVIAGRRIGPFSGGVAPEASIVSARIISDTPTSAGTQGYSLSRVNYDLANAGAKIINNSWSLPDWDLSDTKTTNNYVNAYQYFIASRGGLVVFASGNDSNANPDKIAALPTIAGSQALEKGWLVVSAVDINNPNKLASYANACGNSMNYCLVAPGTTGVLNQDSKTGELNNSLVSGTSFAAPQVSGAAALVWQAFPYFTNDLVRQTLLGTATDLGAPGIDAVFGHGMLNTAAAVRGPAKFDWGDVSVSFSGYTSTWSNSISGAGGLIKNGTGTLVLTENASYTGTTNILGGMLASEKGIMSDVSIGNAGTLNVRRVGGNVNNQGRVMLQNGQTNFAHNYTQTANGQLALVLGSTLNVAGSASVAGDLHVLAVPQGYVTSTQRQNVLTAQQGLNGKFSTFTKEAGVFLDANVNYDAKNAWLDIQRVQATNVQGVQYNAAATAGAIRLEQAFTQLDQQQANSPVPADYKQSEFLAGAANVQQAPNAQAAQASLESLSGQLPAASTAMTMQAINVNNRQISNHIAQLVDSPRSNGWTSNINYQSSLNSGGFSGVNYNMNGWAMGQDVFLDKNTFIGSSLTRSDTSGSLKRGSESSTGTVGEASLYGGKIFDSYYVSGRIASGYYDGQQKRTLWLGNQSANVQSDQSGSYFNVGSEMGYRMKKDGWQFTPYVDTQYISLKQDAFKEEGASGFGLQANAQTTTRWQAGVGTRAGYGWDMGNKGKINLTAQTHYQRAIAQDNGSYNASFTGLNQYMPLDGVSLSRDVVMVGSGLEWLFTDDMALYMNYEQYFSDNQQSNMVNMNVSVRF